jgi:hypothetical protein
MQSGLQEIVRIFAHWVIVCCGQLRENYKSSPHFWATLINCEAYTYMHKFGEPLWLSGKVME